MQPRLRRWAGDGWLRAGRRLVRSQVPAAGNRGELSCAAQAADFGRGARMKAVPAALYQAAAHCLDYPDAEFRERLSLLSTCAPELRPFIEYAAALSQPELARNYVQTFDF